MSMEELIAKVAEIMNAPEVLVERSAQARAGASGQTVEQVLTAWAGGESVSETPTETESAEDVSTEDAATETVTKPTDDGEADSESTQPEPSEPTEITAPSAPIPPPTPEPKEGQPTEDETPIPTQTPSPAPPPVTQTAPPSVPAATTISPPPVFSPQVSPPPTEPLPPLEEIESEDAWKHAEITSVAISRLKEKTAVGIPRWLSALMLIIPVFGLIYLAASAESDECSDTGYEVSIDRISGEAVNCDGSPYAGRGDGGGGQNFIALGERLYRGTEIAAVNCATCHGNNGQGGVGPEMGSVIAVFGSCADHTRWVEIGSGDWPEASYGDTAKPVNGGMPGFSTNLTPEQLAAVVAFERVRYGGGEVEEVLADCGLLEDETEEGETVEDGEGESEDDSGTEDPAGTDSEEEPNLEASAAPAP